MCMCISRRAFTLIETLIVMAIVAIVAGIGLVMSMDSYRGYSFRTDRDALVALLQHARAQAIGNVCLGDACIDGVDHGVRIDDGRYVLFQGSSWDVRDADLDEVVDVSLAIAHTGTNEVVFRHLSGAATAGTITLSDEAGRSSTITIGAEGQITWTH